MRQLNDSLPEIEKLNIKTIMLETLLEAVNGSDGLAEVINKYRKLVKEL